MTDNSFIENEDRQALRKSVSAWASNYGAQYYLKKARAHEHTTELWSEAGKLGLLGVNLPEEYGGGGAGMYELSLVMEEMAAAGSALAARGGQWARTRAGLLRLALYQADAAHSDGLLPSPAAAV